MRCRGLLRTVSFIALSAFPLAGCRTVAADAAPAAAGQKAALVAASSELPTPPQQTAPWSPPTGADANGFSPELIAAVPTLFAQGIADPRGGEYQAITVEVGDVWSGRGSLVETHGWVFPAANGAKRFAVCWNGLVYPVVSSKGAADLQADAENLVSDPKDKKGKMSRFSGYNGDAASEAQSLAPEYPSPLKTVMLLRLNRPDFARLLLALWEKDVPALKDANGITRRDPYGILAKAWAWAAYDRAVCAHMRGADTLVLFDCDLLLRAQPQMEDQAKRRSYPIYTERSARDAALYLPFLRNLPELKSDAARRVSEGLRPPLDLPALQKLPQKQRIAALIARLDAVAARQSGQPGGVGLDEDPITQALIKEGDAAIEPLLDAMETDTRLTRSVSFSRDFHQDRNLLSVKSAAFVCFSRITDIREISNITGNPSSAGLRGWWAKNKNVPLEERWLNQLADDGEKVTYIDNDKTHDESTKRWAEQSSRTHSNEARWMEAAKNIAERSNIKYGAVSDTIFSLTPGTLPPMKGEVLRSRQNPSVADLLQKRAEQISEPTEGRWGFDFSSGANFALLLYEWEPNNPNTLPTLQKTMHRCLAFQNAQEKGQGHSEQFQMGGRIARLTIARVRLGDDAAALEYEGWLRTVSPQYLGFETDESLQALWDEPNAALFQVAERLFAPGPPTPWNRIFTDPKSRDNYLTEQLMGSDLLRVPAFRNLVIRRLTDKTPAGEATQNGDDIFNQNISWTTEKERGPSPYKQTNLQIKPARICDHAAFALRNVFGLPFFDLFASPAKRDKMCAALAAALEKRGPELGRIASPSGPSPLFSYGGSDRFGYLGPIFSVAGAAQTATADDVKAGRALFTLSGTTRVAPNLPSLPFEAAWDTDPDAAIALQSGDKSDSKIVRYSRGFVWQAEDKWDGKKWVRFFGYVGPHSIAKVPADQIRITDYRARAQKTPPAPQK